jgi:hypothetical protein
LQPSVWRECQIYWDIGGDVEIGKLLGEIAGMRRESPGVYEKSKGCC